jgi:hypothetical protein
MCTNEKTATIDEVLLLDIYTHTHTHTHTNTHTHTHTHTHTKQHASNKRIVKITCMLNHSSPVKHANNKFTFSIYIVPTKAEQEKE